MSEYTAEELATLTPEERSAMELETGDEDALNSIANEEDEDGEQNVDSSSADQSTDDVSNKANDDEVVEPNNDATSPIYKVDAPEDTQALRAELSTKKSDALAKLLDGEITAAEYSSIESDVMAQITAMDTAIVKAQVAQEMTQQQLQREWKKELDSLAATAKTEGLDYKADAAKGEEFDTLLRVFGNEAIAKGMTDDGLKASKWALAQAHSVMKTRYGIVTKVAAAKQEVAQEPKGPRHGLTTLTNMPIADRANVSNDTVSRLGSLNGADDLEKAMATMSEKEIEQLMASV